MSRTYRRKNAEWDMWVSGQKKRLIWSDSYDDVHVDTKDGKIARNRFHSDAQMTMEQVPKWYKVIFLRRPFRRKQRVALIQALQRNEDPVMPVDKKIKNYYY